MTDIAVWCVTGRDFGDNRDLGRLSLLSEVYCQHYYFAIKVTQLLSKRSESKGQ